MVFEGSESCGVWLTVSWEGTEPGWFGLRKETTTKKTERKCEIFVLDSKGYLNNGSVEWTLALLVALFFRALSKAVFQCVIYTHIQCGVYMYTHCGMCCMSHTVWGVYVYTQWVV